VYVIAIKNLLQAEFLQVVPVSLLQPKDTICCWARDAVEYENGQSYLFGMWLCCTATVLIWWWLGWMWHHARYNLSVRY